VPPQPNLNDCGPWLRGKRAGQAVIRPDPSPVERICITQ
jgi:hypothetical protein